MLIEHYYALAAGAVLLTAAWVFRPEERTTVTSLGAFIGWSLVALLGSETQTYDPAIEEVVQTEGGNELAVHTTGEMVAAPVPDEMRLFAALWAVLSGLALVLYLWGVYPPTTGDPYGEDPSPEDLT